MAFDEGKLKLYLRCHIKQTKEEIHDYQVNYTKEIILRFDINGAKVQPTSMTTNIKMDIDPKGKSVDSKKFRSLIGSLLYLTINQLGILFVISLCARFLSSAKEFHLMAIKRNLRYLKGTLYVGHWYSKTDSLNLVGYTNSNNAGLQVGHKKHK